MDYATETDREHRIRRDIRLSGIIGPFRVGLPMVAYFFLYPIIIERSGLSVLGLWSLIATLSAYIGLANVGFSSLFIRALGAGGVDIDLSQIARERTAAGRFYIAVTAVLLGLWLIAADILIGRSDSAAAYPPIPLVAGVIVYIIGLGIAITAQLDSAILNGVHQTYAVQIIDTFSPVIFYSLALGGALLSRPIEGLAVGGFVAALFQFVAYKFRIRRHFPAWRKHVSPPSLSETVQTCASLMRRGVHFYTISLGFILREPIFRAVIASGMGLNAAGVYELASRIPAVIRELFVVGARSLFPAFCYYHARGLIDDLHRLIRHTLILLIAFGHMALLSYAVTSTSFLELWLPVLPPDLVSATLIMTLFWGITLLNVPFWYLLHANGNEKVAAKSLLYHTAAILLLYPLTMLVSFSLHSMLWYWLLTSIMTQISIYTAAERTTGAVYTTIFSRPIIFLGIRFLVAATVLVVLKFGFSRLPLDGSITMGAMLVAAALLFSVLLLPMTWPIIKATLISRIVPREPF